MHRHLFCAQRYMRVQKFKVKSEELRVKNLNYLL